MIEIRCGRCERHGRLSVKRLLAQYGPDESVRTVMQAQIGECPHRDNIQTYICCPTLAQLFGVLDRNNGVCSNDPDAGRLVGQESNSTVVVKYDATSIAA